VRLLEAIYYRLRDLTSRPEERGERSAGFLQDKIRQTVAAWTEGYRGRLLEVGCGEGLLLARIARANPALDITGIDHWPEILERGRVLLSQKGLSKIRLEKAEAGLIPFPDDSFDSVLIVDVLMCIKEDREVKDVFAEIGRVCRPGGRLIVEFRNRSNVLLRWKYRWARFYDGTLEDHPLRTYARKEMRVFLGCVGFDVVREARVGFGVASIIWEAVKR
jgi:SAM-dependent methyltransferase